MIRTTTFFLFALLLAGSDQPSPSGIAISNITVIDAVNGVRERQTVIFDGDEIISVAPTSDEDPAAVQAIDGSGQFLIPGLWDMHVHLTYDDAVTDLMPRSFLYYGVTSVRDTGGLMRKMKPVVDRMREPGAVSPRVFYAGPLLDAAAQPIRIRSAHLSSPRR